MAGGAGQRGAANGGRGLVNVFTKNIENTLQRSQIDMRNPSFSNLTVVNNKSLLVESTGSGPGALSRNERRGSVKTAWLK